MEFEYIYSIDGERFSYIILPKILVKGDQFKSLSSDAKILYACLLERTSLSIKNKWIDSEDRVYIIFTIEEVMETLNISNKTAIKILSELDADTKGIGLIERKRQGLGKPNIIYVKDFMRVKRDTKDTDTKKENISEMKEEHLRKCKSYTSEVKNLHSRSEDITFQEVKNLHGTNLNHNKLESIKPNLIKGKNGFGSFGNVFLTEDELSGLRKTIGIQLDNYIERLSSYLKSTGKSYKDHSATILSWYYKDEGNKKKSNTWSIEDYDKGEHL